MRYLFDRKTREEVDIDIVHVNTPTRKVMAVIVGAVAVFCALFAIGLFALMFLDKTLKSNDVPWMLVIGAILVWADIFLFGLSIRMFRGQEDEANFVSPRTFRVAAFIAASFGLYGFVRSVVSGDVKGAMGCLLYLGLGVYLWKVANLREKRSHNQSQDPTP